MAEERTNEKSPSTGRRRTRRIALGALAAIFVAAGAAYWVHWQTVGRYRESTEDAYVAGNRVPVMAEVRGTVVALASDDTRPVRRGQTIVRLDDTDARVALEQAEARLASTVRRVESDHARERQLRAQVATREAALKLALSDYARQSGLHEQGYFATSALEHTATSIEVDRHALLESQQALKAARVELGDTDLADHPDVKLAAAELRAAWLAVERTSILAPVSGFVANRAAQIGQQIEPGTQLMSVVPSDQIWVEANFKESQLDGIRVGQSVLMHADAYGSSVAFRGRVIGIGAGTGSAFSLLPPQNATGNWIKVVQRVPVRIGISRDDVDRHRLQIGLSMQVVVDTRSGAGTPTPADVVDPSGYSTWVYAERTAVADRMIARVIGENRAPPAESRPGNPEAHLAGDVRGHEGEIARHGG